MVSAVEFWAAREESVHLGDDLSEVFLFLPTDVHPLFPEAIPEQVLEESLYISYYSFVGDVFSFVEVVTLGSLFLAGVYRFVRLLIVFKSDRELVMIC